MEQDAINKYRKLYAESTNELVKKTAKEKLEQAGISLTETKEAKKEEKKEEKKAEKKSVKKEEKKTEAKAKPSKSKKPKRTSAEADEKDCEELEELEGKAKNSGYDLEELLTKAKTSKAKAKARAQAKKKEPKKTPATKSREAVEKTAKRVEKTATKLTAIEVEKLIGEYEDAIVKLKKVLAKIKAEKKMAKGGGLSGRSKTPKVVYTQFEEEDYSYGKGKTVPKKKGNPQDYDTTTGEKRSAHAKHQDKVFGALASSKKAGARESEKFADVEATKGHTGYTRRNGNQFYNQKGFYVTESGKKKPTVGKSTGGREYHENRSNRSDDKKYYEKGTTLSKKK